ncbi:hypothetical protein [Chamaesiphon polymorphus]|nr:hypothetical protein [Chamaesiphon polymorphus]
MCYTFSILLKLIETGSIVPIASTGAFCVDVEIDLMIAVILGSLPPIDT